MEANECTCLCQQGMQGVLSANRRWPPCPAACAGSPRQPESLLLLQMQSYGFAAKGTASSSASSK